MNYKIEFSNRAYKVLAKLEKQIRKRISDHLTILCENPRHPELDIKKIKAQSSLYRLRVGDHRILYSIEDKVLIINVIKIGNRSDVYNDL